jgi:hypothetical protein
MKSRCFRSLLILVAIASAPLVRSDDAVTRDDAFTAKVAPLLSARCLSCHNDQDRKGDFSLQHRKDAFDSGYLIPGDPKNSELLNVVQSLDGAPPSMPKNADPLTGEETEILRDWIASGGAWPESVVLTDPVVDDATWWSLQPLVVSPPPRFPVGSPEAAWVRTPIDAFILAEQQKHQLSHVEEADRRVLIRRLFFDLTGLPPTPEQVAEFVADSDPLAYETLVDSLLESPAYGERWARHWLDVVKYADTCGYDKDKLRPNAWPYRDYVVRSFNDDKPYSQFVEEQIAGDVLFPGTPDGVLGLGFLAAGPWDFIGHVEVPESKIDGQIARHTDRDEMVSNTLNTFCSATIQCCQCHNHKFDPFTQQHYYNLQAVFAAVDRADRVYELDPEVESRRQELNQELATNREGVSKLEEEIRLESGEELARLEQSIQQIAPRAEPTAKRPEYGYHSDIAPLPDVDKWVQVDLGREMEIDRIVLHPCHDEFAGIGSGFGFPVRFKVIAAQEENGCVTPAAENIVFDAAEEDFASPGIAPVTIPTRGRSARYLRIAVNCLAARQNDYIFALAEIEVFDRDGRNVALGAAVASLDSIEAPDRWRRKNLTDGIWPQAADESAALAVADLQRERSAVLKRVYTPERLAKRQRLERRETTLQLSLDSLPAGQVVYAAATEFAPEGNFQPTHGVPRPVKLLHRGNVQQPVGETTPGTIPVITGQPAEFELPPEATEGDRRAALAQWITRRDHPLTWRSIVNRVWQYHFGRGIVDSPNDFGRMGQQPTHPELLDWLAADFRDHGMSFKRLHRLIVTSSVYRQASTHHAENAAIDGDNRSLWRMNRRRLEAEELRDAMLTVSGRMNRQMGGPGYYLFVLERPEHSPHYEYEKFDVEDPASHRRSVYRFVVRSQPDPYMTTLDCADSSQSTPQRNETLTALQALSLLNNDFSLAMSKHFASVIESQRGDRPAQIEWAFQSATGRPPHADELDALIAFADQHGLPAMCRVLLNLSEFVFVD